MRSKKDDILLSISLIIVVAIIVGIFIGIYKFINWLQLEEEKADDRYQVEECIKHSELCEGHFHYCNSTDRYKNRTRYYYKCDKCETIVAFYDRSNVEPYLSKNS